MTKTRKSIGTDGTIYYRNKNDELHREKGPAVIYTDGGCSYYLNNELRRTISFAGIQRWSKNGQYHREDGPAVILSDGTRIWFKNGCELTR